MGNRQLRLLLVWLPVLHYITNTIMGNLFNENDYEATGQYRF